MSALLADIGGTNARFALLRDGEVGEPAILPVADFASAEDAIAAALDILRPEHRVRQAVLALAGPVIEEPVRLTNAPWSLASDAIARHFGFDRVRLVNDFLAQAQALPHLRPDHLVRIGEGHSVPGAPMIVVGPGTGLGAAGLVPTASGPLAIPTEGGHIGLAPASPRQDAVIAALRARCGRAGAEEALSGRGLASLHAVVADLQAANVPEREASAVVDAAHECPVAQETLEHFLDFLAAYAGDMALAWGARGGVFIAGGIMPRLLDLMNKAQFRMQFEAKAPMRHWMADVPLAVITHPAPAFAGLVVIAGS